MTLSAMTMSPNPAQVHALVVGVETYGLGAGYSLDGPAQDGLNFIDWLLSHQVPPGQVHFFVSPLAKNAAISQRARDKGVNVCLASRDAIDGFIRNQLITEQMQGEGLQVFWGGHGVLTKIQTAARRLFFADTTAENKLNLELDSLLQALATAAHGAGFERQIFWVDACANSYFDELYETVQADVAGQRYSATGEDEKAEQFVLFAAADYEVAKNDVTAGTGVFSREVLEALEGQPLWPDMEALARRVQATMREKGVPEPVYRWVKSHGCEQIFTRAKTALVKIGQPSFRHVKKRVLERRLKTVLAQYEALNEQYDECLDAGVKVILESKISKLAEQAESLELEIDQIG